MARYHSSRARDAAHFPAFEPGAPGTRGAGETTNPALAPFKALIKRLSEAYGPSGSEERVRDLVRDEIKTFVDQARVDALGNLIALRRGSGAHRKKIMLAAHLDEIGVMITFVESNGFARFGALGAVKPLTLLGARCQFADGTLGVFGREEWGATHDEIEADKLFIDVGAASAETSLVRVGDAACFARDFVDAGAHLIGKALNDRVGCAILIETLRQLKKSPHDVYAVFTVQQNVGTRGAGVAAYAVQPDYAFVVETTAAGDVPGGNARGIALGQGPVIQFKDDGLIASPAARQALLHAAREARVSCQLQVNPRGGGDGAPIQASRGGVQTGALAIPLRYMHTPSEMIHYADAQNAVHVLMTLLSKPL